MPPPPTTELGGIEVGPEGSKTFELGGVNLPFWPIFGDFSANRIPTGKELGGGTWGKRGLKNITSRGAGGGSNSCLSGHLDDDWRNITR